MSAEMFAKIMQNTQRDNALVEQSPRQPLADDRTPQTHSDMMLGAISNMLKRRQPNE
jgi:hypothetical protein